MVLAQEGRAIRSLVVSAQDGRANGKVIGGAHISSATDVYQMSTSLCHPLLRVILQVLVKSCTII